MCALPLHGHVFSWLLGTYVGVDLLGHRAALLRGCHADFPEAAPLCVPTSSAGRLGFGHILPNTCYCLFDYSLPMGAAWTLTDT